MGCLSIFSLFCYVTLNQISIDIKYFFIPVQKRGCFHWYHSLIPQAARPVYIQSQCAEQYSNGFKNNAHLHDKEIHNIKAPAKAHLQISHSKMFCSFIHYQNITSSSPTIFVKWNIWWLKNMQIMNIFIFYNAIFSIWQIPLVKAEANNEYQLSCLFYSLFFNMLSMSSICFPRHTLLIVSGELHHVSSNYFADHCVLSPDKYLHLHRNILYFMPLVQFPLLNAMTGSNQSKRTIQSEVMFLINVGNHIARQRAGTFFRLPMAHAWKCAAIPHDEATAFARFYETVFCSIRPQYSGGGTGGRDTGLRRSFSFLQHFIRRRRLFGISVVFEASLLVDQTKSFKLDSVFSNWK